MARQRERFERTDVPEASVQRSLISFVVLLAVGLALFLLITSLWNRVQSETRLSDDDIAAAIEKQADQADYEGAHLTNISYECIATLLVSELDLEQAELVGAQLLVSNTSAKNATVVNIRPDVRVYSSEGNAQSLEELFANEGPYACLRALVGPTNIRSTHAIIASEEPWERIAAHSPGKTSTLDIMMTDMDDAALVSLGEALSSVGSGGVIYMDAPSYQEEYAAEDGTMQQTGRTLIDEVELNLALGLIAFDA